MKRYVDLEPADLNLSVWQLVRFGGEIGSEVRSPAHPLDTSRLPVGCSTSRGDPVRDSDNKAEQ